jgi:hypothetical protein
MKAGAAVVGVLWGEAIAIGVSSFL